jgi:YegS/Rv2252/BmrU family lipid kinase
MALPSEKILVLINPISGGNSDKGNLAELARATLDAERYDVDIVITEHRGHATELATQAVADGARCVVAVGGDGTVNEIGAVLRGTDTALAVVPTGSGNGLARHIHIPMNAAAALQVVNDMQIEEVDFCTVNDRPFFCTCGVGFDAQVSHKFANEDTRGLITYVKTTINEFFHYKSQDYRITIGDQSWQERAFVIACCNAAQYGNNAIVAPRASMRDGKIDMTIIHSFKLPEAALLSARLFTSTIDRDRNVSIYRASRIAIDRDVPGIMHLDGEPVEMPEHLDICCHSLGLRVVVPNPGRDI